MRTIARLFGKSPFAPLQTHMNKVTHCLEKLTQIIASPSQKLVDELCRLEHEADITKNDIRNHLPNSVFMPIDRSQFLEILSLQDKIADQAEEIGITFTLKPLSSTFLPFLAEFYQKKSRNIYLRRKNHPRNRSAHRIILRWNRSRKSENHG